jgi:quinol monooxygenase YgiN
VAVKDHPTQIRIFETYADRAAYESHLQTPHFKKYKTETANMVKSLKLVETDPILLGTK